MPGLIQVWQWGSPIASERNLAEICDTALAFGFDGLVVKCLDGLDWAASYFFGEDAPDSVAQVTQQHAYCAGRGLQYYAGVNPLYFDDARLDEEAALVGELANVTDGVVLDLEPFARYWGANRVEGAATRFLNGVRAVSPAGVLIFQPDPRPDRLQELRPEEWFAQCDILAGQHYWPDFSSDPTAELTWAKTLGEQWGKPIWPTLPGNAHPGEFPLDLIAANPGFLVWRLGSTGPAVLSLLGPLVLSGEEPPVGPEPDPQPLSPAGEATFADLVNWCGYIKGDVADGLTAEADRAGGPRPEQVRAIAELLRS